MEIGNLIPHIESLIFASEKPLTTIELTDLINQAFGFMEDKIILDQVESALEGIIEKYSSEFFPFEVRESGGGWQFLTKKDYHKTVAQLNGDKFLKRLSTAALETLSIIAYKQPITKAEIEAIRGVSSDYAIQKLLEKELVSIIGRNETMPGHPLVYATSKSFMDYFGINTTDDLPKLKDVIDDSSVTPAIVNEAGEAVHEDAPENFEPAEEDTSFTLEVDENGQLVEVRTAEEQLADNNNADVTGNTENEPGQEEEDFNEEEQTFEDELFEEELETEDKLTDEGAQTEENANEGVENNDELAEEEGYQNEEDAENDEDDSDENMDEDDLNEKN
ncbi:SMC-Scp complex subunit ScpB [Gynurincola endophyticus]|uniref:SMC-Scp complex subunit ScpB n=1 Tax=Gynurincola endophyticus TaxID=2479004 RepID=UPI000F8DA36C|nr:SMC-Scp complex subunit ScpB [Gynurincola endophyticus]